MIKPIVVIAIILSINLSANSKLKKECDNGQMQSCIELGILYHTGESVKKDMKKAQVLFSKACKNRVARGCYYLGFIYLRGGKGIEQSNRKAILAFAKGCDIGSERSCVQYHRLKAKGY